MQAPLRRDPLERPILVIGAARSGTSMVSGFFKLHPDVVVWIEPNYVWKRKFAWLGHDAIPGKAATPRHAEELRKYFRDHCLAHGGGTLCEKTPSNSLRLDFVSRVLPGARFVHIVRDGRNAAVSARAHWSGNLHQITRDPKYGASVSKLKVARYFATTMAAKAAQPAALRDLPFYLPRLARYVRRHLGWKAPDVWGPRFPGIREAIRERSLIEVCALQWQACVDAESAFFEAHPEVDVIHVKYEDLCANPRDQIEAIFRFCGLEMNEAIAAKSGELMAPDWDAWRKKLKPEEIDKVDALVGDTLARLGY